MRFVIDLDSLEVIESANDRRKVTQVEGKRGDDSPFEVVFVRSGIAEELAASSVLTFGAKQEGKYDAAAVVLENGFTLSGTGPTAVYSGNPSFNTAALNALFLIDANDANDPAYVDLMAEFTWQVGAGAPTSTKTFRFRVHNDVVRDDEVSPTPAYSPIGDTAPTNLTNASGTLTFAANPSDGDQVEINSVAYTFVDDLLISDLPYNVQLGPAASYSLANLYCALTRDGMEGIQYGTDTPINSVVTAAHEGGASLSVTAITEGSAGNEITTVTSATGTSWGAATLTGGMDLTATPPYIRVAGGFLYIQEAGVWKKTALSAL